MIWPLFGLFWMLKKTVYFKDCFGESWAKLEIFYEILTLNFVILTNFLPNFAFIWPFFFFEDLAFFETAHGQILPFQFFWTWQPWTMDRINALDPGWVNVGPLNSPTCLYFALILCNPRHSRNSLRETKSVLTNIFFLEKIPESDIIWHNLVSRDPFRGPPFGRDPG